MEHKQYYVCILFRRCRVENSTDLIVSLNNEIRNRYTILLRRIFSTAHGPNFLLRPCVTHPKKSLATSASDFVDFFVSTISLLIDIYLFFHARCTSNFFTLDPSIVALLRFKSAFIVH